MKSTGPYSALESIMGSPHAWEKMVASSNALEKAIGSYQNFDVTLVSDDVIEIKDQIFSLDEINNTVSGIVRKIEGMEDEQDSFCDRFFNEIEKLSVPLKQIFYRFLSTLMIGIIVQIIITLRMASYTESLKNNTKNNQSTIREIKKESKKQLKNIDLSQFRFVTANILNVREDHSQKSKRIDKLAIGQGCSCSL